MNGQAEAQHGGTLILCWGNPSRGDDALGLRLAEWLITEKPGETEILTDFQLQIEYALDLEKRKRILFIDSASSGPAPFQLQQIHAEQDHSYSSHALSPQALLVVYARVYKSIAPPSFLLTIRGYHFELGQALSKQAELNLEQAIDFTRHQLLDQQTAAWNEACNRSNARFSCS